MNYSHKVSLVHCAEYVNVCYNDKTTPFVILLKLFYNILHFRHLRNLSVTQR